MREHIYFFLVTCVMLVMCNSNKSYAGAVGDNDTVKWTAMRPFGVVTITFFHFFFFKVQQKFGLGFSCDQSWIVEFGLIPAGSGEKCIHQNNRFWYQFWYQGWLILSAVYYPYWRIRQFMIDSPQCINWQIPQSTDFQIPQYMDCVIGRFCTLQIDKFHNWQTNWFLNLWIFKLDNLQIVWLADSSIYRFCANWQTLQAQIEIFLNWHIVWLWDLLRFYSPHIGRFLNLWTMWLAEFASDRFHNLWIDRSLNHKKLTDSSIYRLLELHIFPFMDCQIPQSINCVIGIFCKLQIEIFLN